MKSMGCCKLENECYEQLIEEMFTRDASSDAGSQDTETMPSISFADFVQLFMAEIPQVPFSEMKQTALDFVKGIIKRKKQT